MNTTIQTNLSNIDQLGFLTEQIKVLTEQADAIKDQLKSDASLSGTKAFVGTMFIAAFSESNRTVVDYKTMLKDLNVAADVVAKYTKISAVYSIKTTPIKG